MEVERQRIEQETMSESEGYHNMWPDRTREESSDRPAVDDAAGD
jgi:hypothetical protein